jgi:hypothetical protein
VAGDARHVKSRKTVQACRIGLLNRTKVGLLIASFNTMGCGASQVAPRGQSPFDDLPMPFDGKIDAVISNNLAGAKRIDYLFSGGLVLEYTVWAGARHRLKAIPCEISSHEIFGQLPAPFNDRIDATIWNGEQGAGRIDYIFSDDQVLEFTAWPQADERVKAAPDAISSSPIFSQLPVPFENKIEATTCNGERGANRIDYLFCDGLVLEFTVWSHAQKRLRAEPCPISEHEMFKQLKPGEGDNAAGVLIGPSGLPVGLPAAFDQQVDAVVWNGLNGAKRIDYLFCGGQVVEYTVWPAAAKRVKAAPREVNGGVGVIMTPRLY